MSGIFLEIVRISFCAAMITAVIWIVRTAAGVRLSARFRCAAWMILVLRLLLPFEIPSPVSLFSYVSQPAEETVQSTFSLPSEAGTDAEFPNAEAKDSDSISVPEPEAANPQWSWQLFFTWFWVTGIGIMLLFFILTYCVTAFRLRRPASGEFPEAKQCFAENREKYLSKGRVRLWPTDAYSSPFLFGVFRPKIVLPRGMAERANEAELTAVIAHELVHIKKKHAVCNIILYLLKAVYWFNPAVWLAFFLLKQDMEMLCDEGVVKNCSQAEKRGYAEAVVNTAAGIQVLPPGAALFAEKRFLKERIRNIMRQKSTKLYSSIAGGVLLLFLSFILLTTGKPLSIELAPQNLQQMQENQTNYVGDNAKVGALISLLDDDYSGFYDMDHFELHTAEEPYGLTVYYVWKDGMIGHIPFRSSDSENNALLLMCFIQNADRIEFVMAPSKEDITSQNEDMLNRKIYTREEMTQKFGDLDQLAADLSQLTKVLKANHKVDEEFAHFNRCRWGVDQEYVIYRNGDPNEIVTNDDGSTVLIYNNLGEVTQTGEDGTVQVIPGYNVSFYLNSPEAIEHGLSGVYRFDANGGSELLFNIGLEDNASREEVIEKLGDPTAQQTIDGKERYLYAVYGRDGWYIYFDFTNGVLTQHGITVDYTG